MTMQLVRIGGTTHPLGKRLGKGGEGEVYAIGETPDRAVKIYKESLRKEREQKIRAMVSGELSSKTDLVAFPADIATDSTGRFVGFVMRQIRGYKPIHQLYSPKSRRLNFPRADYRFLIRAALNVARAVASVHQAGCIIGDFNHSGVLVADDATVALIDADSFQFSINGQRYSCVVGVPDFTPPELHGVNLSTVVRTKAHDHFGLAVAIFQLLAMGRHPYAGRYTGADLTIGEAIEQNRFAFSTQREQETKTRPPPGSVSLADFPRPIASAFEAAFGLVASNRPSAADWVALLKELEGSLSRCGIVPSHFYPSAAGKCVWCRLAVQSGVDMFPDVMGTGPTVQSPGAPFDIERAWAQVRAVTFPSPADIIPSFTGTVPETPAVAEAKHGLTFRRATGFLVLAATVAGFVYAPQFALVWLGLGIFGLFRAFTGSIDTSPFVSAYVAADEKARDAELAYLNRLGLTELYAVRAELEGLIAEYRRLDDDLQRSLAQAKAKREARQRDAFLDRFHLRSARISGLGPGRTTALISFGVETAADVTESAVRAVPGFGEVLTSKLLAWRRGHEAKFRYNPAPDASDIQAESAIRATSDAKRSALVAKIRSGLQALQSGPQRIAERAKAYDRQLTDVLRERARAAKALQDLGQPVPASPPLPFPQRSVHPASAVAGRTSPNASPRPVPPPPATATSARPSCPRCGSPMVRRTARRGRNAGNQFWGCSRYPACKGTRN